MTPATKFCGTWLLDPAQSRYEAGAPPREGTYTIGQDGDRLTFHARWVDQEGNRHEVQFIGIPDGHRYALKGQDAELCTSLPDERTLDTTVYKNGETVAIGRRTLSPDGNTLTVTQSGAAYTNLSVYRRR